MANILIIDDDKSILRLLEFTLQRAGHTVTTYSDGEEGLQQAETKKPDLIVVDVMMPKMNGFEVCNIIKNDLTMKGTYIIMLTAKGQELDKQKAKTVGADFYITKPFNIHEIKKKVSEIFNTSLK